MKDKIKSISEKFKKKNKIHLYLLIIILIVGFFLRFYNFPYRYGLGEETVRDAVIGIEGARERQAPLTGAFSSLGPFTFGPLYGYQLIISYLIFPFNYSPWIYLGIISVIYIFIIFKVGELLEGKTFGLILALLAAVSPAQVISGTHLTSHNNTNIFAILAIWIFLRILLRNGPYLWGLALGISLGFGISLHYQMAGLLVLPFLLLVVKLRRYLYSIYAGLGVFITFIPILFFELNNHWFNTRNMIYYLRFGKNAIYVPNRWLFYVRDFWPSFWADSLGVPVFFSFVIIILLSVIIILSYKNKQITLPLALLIIAFFLNFISLRYYWGQRFFGYLNYLRPFVFIFTGYVFLYFYKRKILKYLGIILLILTILYGIPRNIYQLEKDGLSSQIYNEVTVLESRYPGKKFNMYGCTDIYRGSYNAKLFSFIFLLDLKNKLDKSGIKLAVESEDCSSPAVSSADIKNAYVKVKDTMMIDYSNASEGALLSNGWKSTSFKSIYELNARWWFKEQP